MPQPEEVIDTLDGWFVAIVASPWVLVVVFVVAGLDAIIPLAPSESTVIAVAVVSAETGRPVLALVILTAIVGAYTGDRLSYAIGRRVGPRMTTRLRRNRRGLAAYTWAHRLVHRRGGLLILLARYLPGGRSASTLAAGALAYPLSRFRWYTTFAVTVWASWAALLGYFGGTLFAGDPVQGLLFAYAVAGLAALTVEVVRRLHPRIRGASRVRAGGGLLRHSAVLLRHSAVVFLRRTRAGADGRP